MQDKEAFIEEFSSGYRGLVRDIALVYFQYVADVEDEHFLHFAANIGRFAIDIMRDEVCPHQLWGLINRAYQNADAETTFLALLNWVVRECEIENRSLYWVPEEHNIPGADDTIH